MTDSEPSLLEKPQLTVDLAKARGNIARMVAKFQRHGVCFRPHFKTHQCAAIGEVFSTLRNKLARGADERAAESVLEVAAK